MAKIIVDQLQKLGGTAVFNIPTSVGTANQVITTNGSGTLSFTSGAGGSGQVAPEGVGVIGCIVTHSDRQNTYSTPEWSSGGPWTTFYNYDIGNDNSAVQFMNMTLGDGMGESGSSQGWIGDSERVTPRQLQFASGNRLGHYRDFMHYDNSSSNGGHSWRIMPVRNKSASAISVNFYGYVSNYWNAGYEGGCLAVFYPNTAVYSAVTAVSSTTLATISSTNTSQSSLSGSYSIPANTTVLVCLTSTDQYQTTYRFKDTNYFYNLSTTFSNSNIICDMRMLSSLNKTKFSITSSGAAQGTSLFAPIWTRTATNFGDR